MEVLRPLVSAAAEGAVRDVAFFDFGSTDGTDQIADAAGAMMVQAPARSTASLSDQTAFALAAAPRSNWVLLADQSTVLASGWLSETISFIERQERLITQKGKLCAVFRPDHEPEAGSADLRRRVSIALLNRVFSTAKLSQGLLVRRNDLIGQAAPLINWAQPDPSIRLPGLIRLRSRTHLAQPMDAPQLDNAVPAGQPSAEPR